MTPIPVTVCLMTTTKGHFGVTSRYLSTLESFNKALPLSYWEERIAHIKDSGESVSGLVEMEAELWRAQFETLISKGQWSHGTESHQLNYLHDATKTINEVRTPFVLMLEDDWSLKVYEDDFLKYVNLAARYLDDDPFLIQVRIPRFSNERERINRLKQKHNLDRSAVDHDDHSFLHNDFSMNPAFYRTRDLRAALALLASTNLPKHVEHGLGEALKIISMRPATPFACFNPDKIRVGHTGTRPGEEDDLNRPLIAT